MRRETLLILITFLLCFSASSASATLIGDSVAEFSGVQGQDDWFYGFFNRGGSASTAYDPDQFVEFTEFTTRWQATTAAVGGNAANRQFLNIGMLGGHPTGLGLGQDNIILAIRRFVSPVASKLRIDFDLRKINVVEPRGGGITGRIFVDGNEVFTQFIANNNNTQNIRTIFVDAQQGTRIDFAIDPLGRTPIAGSDDPLSARADGSRFSSLISTSTIPEPSSLVIFGLLGFSFWLGSRRRGRAKS